MKRRCGFLETLPAFIYNTGAGEYITNEQGKRVRTDTRQLGSTLMTTMLREVEDFCHPAIKENWSLKPHQQVPAQAKEIVTMKTMDFVVLPFLFPSFSSRLHLFFSFPSPFFPLSFSPLSPALTVDL